MNRQHSCPHCGGDTMKVIYFGLPGRLCERWECSTLTGLASHAPAVSDGDAFQYLAYEGSYWSALLHWLLGRGDA